MAGEGKAGMAGGVLVVLGLGFARFGDDCARGGVRGAGAMDELAGGGTRMASWGPNAGVDDATRMGLSVDDAARMGARADGAALPGLRGVRVHEALPGARAGEGPWFEGVRDFGIDVGVEIAGADFDGDVPEVVATPGKLVCPKRLEITREPEEWIRLLDGVGIACTPVIVVGTASADGSALRVGEADVPIVGLAQDCAEAGGRCVLMGCPAEGADACVQGSEESFQEAFRHERLRGDPTRFVRGFVERALVQEDAPAVIAQLAVVEGEAKLVIARPGAGASER